MHERSCQSVIFFGFNRSPCVIMLRHLSDFSEAVMITLQEKGLTRDEAYSLVQRNAQSVWTEGGSFQQAVESDPGISRVLSREEISECFDLAHHLRFIDIIFRRVLGD